VRSVAVDQRNFCFLFAPEFVAQFGGELKAARAAADNNNARRTCR
jgi:hypothetical protein